MGIKAGNLPTSTIDNTDYLLITEGEAPKRVAYSDVKNNIIGAETLTTTAQTPKGAINELNASLSERVKKSTINITYYVDTTNGLDTNDGLTSGTAFKTITYAISLLPQVVNHTVIINIISGTYSETPTLNGFLGQGSISVVGGSSLATAVNYIVNSISIKNCKIKVSINGITTSSQANSIYITNCNWVELNYFNTTVSDLTHAGIVLEFSSAITSYCNISNKAIAIHATNNSSIISQVTTGSANTVGLQASSGGKISKYSTQPTATTAESVSVGGVIS